MRWCNLCAWPKSEESPGNVHITAVHAFLRRKDAKAYLAEHPTPENREIVVFSAQDRSRTSPRRAAAGNTRLSAGNAPETRRNARKARPMRLAGYVRALFGENRRLYLRSVPRRMKRMWLVLTRRKPHQCDACLDWFTRRQVILTQSPWCPYRDKGRGACEAFICRRCRDERGYDGVKNGPSCYCDC